MIAWTITPNVEHPDVPGKKFWEVNGDNPDKDQARQDLSDPRHFPTRHAAIKFLISHHMKMGDTLHVAGKKTGRALRIGLTRIEGTDKLEYDIGEQRIEHAADLIDYLDKTLKPGDTVAYLV